MLEKFTKFLIPLSIIVAGLMIGGAFVYINQNRGTILSSKEVGDKVINFINKNMPSAGNAASLISIEEEGSVYKIRLKVGDSEYDSYASKDGKLLFPEGYSLEEKTEEEAVEVQPESSEKEEKPSADKLEALAKCLNEKGAKFYGASWCGWCKKQKELFGEAAQYLPYIECINEETNQTTSECQEAGVSSFPTWEFSGKGKVSGYKDLEKLAELSGCQL